MAIQTIGAFNQSPITRDRTSWPYKPPALDEIDNSGQVFGGRWSVYRGNLIPPAIRHASTEVISSVFKTMTKQLYWDCWDIRRSCLWQAESINMLDTAGYSKIEKKLVVLKRPSRSALLEWNDAQFCLRSTKRRFRDITSRFAGGQAEALEHLTYRVILTLIERDQIGLARKTLEALPIGDLDNPVIARLRKTLAEPSTKVSSKRDIDRETDYQWIRDHSQEYRGKWVALDNGELIGSAGSLRELLDHVVRLSKGRRPLLHMIQ